MLCLKHVSMIYSLCKNRKIYLLCFFLVLFNLIILRRLGWQPFQGSTPTETPSYKERVLDVGWLHFSLWLTAPIFYLPHLWPCVLGGSAPALGACLYQSAYLPARTECLVRDWARDAIRPRRPDFTACRYCCCQEWHLAWRWHHHMEARRAEKIAEQGMMTSGSNLTWSQSHFWISSYLNREIPYLFNLTWISFTYTCSQRFLNDTGGICYKILYRVQSFNCEVEDFWKLPAVFSQS